MYFGSFADLLLDFLMYFDSFFYRSFSSKSNQGNQDSSGNQKNMYSKIKDYTGKVDIHNKYHEIIKKK